MSDVHDEIARNAVSVLPEDERQFFDAHLADLAESAWYPDYFADRSMSASRKAEIDPEADRFIYPEPPQTAEYQHIIALTEKEYANGESPLRNVYLAKHYLREALTCLHNNDFRGAVKMCGVYSHTIADTGEPIHALRPEVIDLVLPPPPEHIGLELHSNVEKLKAQVDISGYRPKLLGTFFGAAVMGAYADLCQVKKIGARQTLPIVQALYANDRDSARELSSVAQNESAKATANFMHTVFALSKQGEQREPDSLDLRNYPYAACDCDMLCRSRPLVDMNLVLFSGGKTHPLTLADPSGQPRQIGGLGVLPFLGPPHAPDKRREARIEYCLEKGAYDTFEARVGMNMLFSEATTTGKFIIYGDGEKLYESPELSVRDSYRDIKVPIVNTTWLVLSMEYCRNATPEEIRRLGGCAWAGAGVWGVPRLTGC
jgi:hypothetical protein